MIKMGAPVDAQGVSNRGRSVPKQGADASLRCGRYSNLSGVIGRSLTRLPVA